MTLIQTPTKAWGMGDGARVSGRALIMAVVVAALVAAVIAASLIVRPNVIGSQGDPLVGPAAVEFRAAEHAAGLSQGDPLLTTSAIEFREDEHAANGSRVPNRGPR